jgi:hypothetical protein
MTCPECRGAGLIGTQVRAECSNCHATGKVVTPNPGSDEAIDRGCICPVLDNGRGNPELGRTRGWWITSGCPLHTESAA